VSGPIEYLDLEDLVGLAAKLLGDPVPVRDLGLLAAAVGRPQATLFGVDAYPDLVAKAAALLQSVVNNHALVDGNKRLGWLATAVFLEINGVEASRIANDAVFDFVIWIASTNPPVEEITTCLSRLLT
jgi:death on curing protein